MLKSFLRSLHYSLWLTLGFFSGKALAGSPTNELLRLVPNDITFTVVVQEMGKKAKSFDESPFWKEFEKLPLGKLLVDAQDPESAKQVEQLLKDFGLTPEQLILDLLGDAVVIAYRDGTDAKELEPQMLFMLHVRDPKLLQGVMDKINDYQKRTGDLKEIRQESYAKRDYSRRVKLRPEEGDQFYFLDGNRFLFSTSEKFLKQSIDRDQNEPAVEKQLPTLAQRFEKLGVEKSMLLWWLNPRAFDAEFKALVERSQGIEKTMLAQFSQIWKGFDGVAVHFDINQSIELGLMVSIQKDALPKSAQPFFTEIGKSSALWQIIPDNALFAMATRIEGTSLLSMLSSLFDTQHREQIESAFLNLFRVFRPEQLKALPKGLGPDLGFWIFDPLEDAKKKIWVPQMLLAIKLRPGSEGTDASDNLRTGCELLATLARFFNGNITVAKSKDDQEEITYLIHDRGFPNGFRPAFGAKGGYFLISASPESIRNFTPPKNPEGKEQSEVPFLKISFKGWRKFLGDHRDTLSQFISQGSADLAKEIKTQLDQLLENLEVFDRLELLQRSRKESLGLLIRLTPTHPLQK
jgi:hypothetical protein